MKREDKTQIIIEAQYEGERRHFICSVTGYDDYLLADLAFGAYRILKDQLLPKTPIEHKVDAFCTAVRTIAARKKDEV